MLSGFDVSDTTLFTIAIHLRNKSESQQLETIFDYLGQNNLIENFAVFLIDKSAKCLKPVLQAPISTEGVAAASYGPRSEKIAQKCTSSKNTEGSVAASCGLRSEKTAQKTAPSQLLGSTEVVGGCLYSLPSHAKIKELQINSEYDKFATDLASLCSKIVLAAINRGDSRCFIDVANQTGYDLLGDIGDGSRLLAALRKRLRIPDGYIVSFDRSGGQTLIEIKW